MQATQYKETAKILFKAQALQYTSNNMQAGQGCCILCDNQHNSQDFNISHFKTCGQCINLIGFASSSKGGFRFYCKTCTFKRKANSAHQVQSFLHLQDLFAHFLNCSDLQYLLWYCLYEGSFNFFDQLYRKLLGFNKQYLQQIVENYIEYLLSVLSIDITQEQEEQFLEAESSCSFKKALIKFLKGQDAKKRNKQRITNFFEKCQFFLNQPTRLSIIKISEKLFSCQVIQDRLLNIQHFLSRDTYQNMQIKRYYEVCCNTQLGQGIQGTVNQQQLQDFDNLGNFENIQQNLNMQYVQLIINSGQFQDLFQQPQSNSQDQMDDVPDFISEDNNQNSFMNEFLSQEVQDSDPFAVYQYPQEIQAPDLVDPYVQRILHILKNHVSQKITIDMVQNCLKKQGLTDRHLQNLQNLDKQHVSETIFPCLSPHLFLDMQQDLYDKNFSLLQMYEILQIYILDQQYQQELLPNSTIIEGLPNSIFEAKMKLSQQFIKGSTGQEIDFSINYGNWMAQNQGQSQVTSWKQAQYKLIGTKLSDHLFHICPYFDHIYPLYSQAAYQNDEWLLYRNRDFTPDLKEVCPNCEILQNRKTYRYKQNFKEDEPAAFFIDYFLEQQLQAILHDPSVYNQIQNFKNNVNNLKSNITSFWGSQYVQDIQDFCERNHKPRDLIFDKGSLSIDILFDGGASHEKSGGYTTDYAYFRICDILDGDNVGSAGLHPLIFIPDFQFNSEKDKVKKLLQLYFKRTFEILNKHGPLGIPLKIPVIQNNEQTILSFTLFFRIMVLDTPSREKLGNTQGNNGLFGCGSCLAQAQHQHGHNRYIQNNCIGFHLIWRGLDILQYTQQQQFQNNCTSRVDNYNLYDGGLEQNINIQRTTNDLLDPLLFNYRSFIADIINALHFNQQYDQQKIHFNEKTGYNRIHFYGSYGTPIFQMYVGLGYIQQQVACPIPPSHNLLHGLCKDICAIIFGEKGNTRTLIKRYQGNIPRGEIFQVQREMKDIVQSRSMQIRPSRNASKQSQDYGSNYQRLKFDEMLSFILIFRGYLFHEKDYNFPFEDRYTTGTRTRQFFNNLLYIFYYIINICVYCFEPESLPRAIVERDNNNNRTITTGQQQVQANRHRMSQNVTETYRLLEVTEFVGSIKNNVHYLQCQYDFMLNKLGSLHQYFEFSMERRIGVSKLQHVNQQYFQSFKHVAKIELFRYQISFLSMVKYQQQRALSENDQICKFIQPVSVQPCVVTPMSTVVLNRFTSQNQRRKHYFKLVFPKDSQRQLKHQFQKQLWEQSLRELLRRYVQGNPTFQHVYDRIQESYLEDSQSFFNCFEIFKRAIVDDHQRFDSRLYQKSNYVTNFVRTKLLDGQYYIFEIYYFVSFRTNSQIALDLNQQIVDTSINLQEQDYYNFESNRFLAAGAFFRADKCGGHFDIGNDCDVFRYDSPVDKVNLELISLLSFDVPVFIADPNNLLTPNRRRQIFRNRNVNDIRVSYSPYIRTNVKRSFVFADQCTTMTQKV